MNILVVTQYFWPESFRINDLVKELSVRGHNITVLTSIPNYPEGKVHFEYKTNPRKYDRFYETEVIRVPQFLRGKNSLSLILNYFSFAFFSSFFGALKLRKRKFDIIFVFEPSPITVGIPAVLIKKIKKIPLVFWVQDLWPESLVATGTINSPFILKVVGRLVSYIYNRCDLILAQSRSFISQISSYCTGHAQIKYFPNWAESLYNSKNVLPTTKVSISKKHFNIMFAGNIGTAQDFPTIVNAAEMIKYQYENGEINRPVRWLIVGDGRQSEWLKNEIFKKKLEDSLVMLGRHPVDEMPSFFAHADAMLVSLKSEKIFSMTIPGKVQSYLAASIPIIAVLNGEGAEVISKSNAGISCKAEDYNELVDAIKFMIKLPKERLDEMGKNGRNYYQQEYEKTLLVDRLENWLDKVIQDSSKKAIIDE